MRASTPLAPRTLGVIAALALPLIGQSCADVWDSTTSPHSGPDGGLGLIKVLDVGSGAELFVLEGGYGAPLTRVDEVPVYKLARFNGVSWSSVGANVPFAPSLANVWDVASYDDGTGRALYAAGQLGIPNAGTPGDYALRWNGAVFVPVGGAADDAVTTLLSFDDGTGPALIAGGMFKKINGVLANRVARWNGISWSAMGPLYTATPLACCPGLFSYSNIEQQPVGFATLDSGSGPQLYVARGSPLNPGGCVQRWNGTTWINVAPANLTSVTRICTHVDPLTGPAIWVAGTYAAGTSVSNVTLSRFDGTNWTQSASVGYGPPFTSSGTVEAIASCDDGSGPALYVSGNFQLVNPVGQAQVASWMMAKYSNGAWSAMPGSPYASPVAPVNNPLASTLAAFPHGGVTRLVAGGSWFRMGSGASWINPFEFCAPFLAKWTGSQWESLTPEKSWYRHPATAMTVWDDGSGSKLYVGGQFHSLGSTVLAGFGRWNGSSWEALAVPGGLGTFRRIECMTVFDDGNGPALYLGTTGQGQTFIYRWNPANVTFTQIGPAMFPPSVKTMTVWDDGSGPKLWIGFGMDHYTGWPLSAFPTLRCWKNGAWQGPMQASGAPDAAGDVKKLLVDSQGRLIAGGTLSGIGGHPVFNVARVSPGWAVDDLGGGIPTPNGVADVAILEGAAGPGLWALARGSYTPPASNVLPPPPTTLTVQQYTSSGWSVARTIAGGWEGILRAVPHQDRQALYVGTSGVQNSVSDPPLAPFALDRFDGLTWTSLGTGMDGQPLDVAGYDDGSKFGVFVAGTFDTLGGIPAGGFARVEPQAPTILVHPASQTVALGQPMTLAVSASGPSTSALAYQWSRGATQIPGATGPAYTIPAAGFASADSYRVAVSNACGVATSRVATVSVRGCDLTISQPSGPGSIGVTLSGGPPFAHAFTALTLDPANATNPGTGPFLGLHVTLGEVLAEFGTQSLPFVATLSASGTALWASPMPPVLVGATVWGVSSLYDPATLIPIGAPSGIRHRVLQ